VEGGELVSVKQLTGPRMVGVLGAGAPPALPDLVARRLQHRLVGGVLPQHQVFDDAEQPLALLVGQQVVEGGRRTWFRDRKPGPFGLLGEDAGLVPQLQTGLEGGLRPPAQHRVPPQHIHVGRRVVHHLREDHRARRRQRAPRPPQMQRARVPMANRLLPRAGLVDGRERQRDFDELLAVAGHHATPVPRPSATSMKVGFGSGAIRLPDSLSQTKWLGPAVGASR